MKKLLVLILLLIAGAVVVLVLTGKKDEDIVPESVMEDLSGTPAVRAITFPASTNTTVTVSKKTDAKAQELIAGAKRFMSLGDPQNARGELEIVERLLCSTEIKKEAETLMEKVLPLYEHLFAMKSEPITAVDPDKRREEFMNKYLEKKDRLPERDALAHYDLAVFCRTKGMDDLAAAHLKTALEIDENVYESVGNKGAKKLYLMAVWFGSMGEKEKKKEFETKLKDRFPSSKYIAMLKEKAPHPEMSTPKKTVKSSASPKKTAAPSPKRTATPFPKRRITSSSLSKWEEEGDKAYNAGIKHYKKSMPLMGMRQFDKENKLALNSFQRAVDYYKKAKREGNAGSGIDTKIIDANSLKYGCFKMSRVR